MLIILESSCQHPQRDDADDALYVVDDPDEVAKILEAAAAVNGARPPADAIDAGELPNLVGAALNPTQRALLLIELESLAEEGYDWNHPRTQCVLEYFKLIFNYGLNYDSEFCAVRQPDNIVSLLKRIQSYLRAADNAAQLEDAPSVANLAASLDEPLVAVQVPDEEEASLDAPSPLEGVVYVDEASGKLYPLVEADEEPLLVVLKEGDEDATPLVTAADDTEESDASEQERALAQALALTETSMTGSNRPDTQSAPPQSAPQAQDKEKRSTSGDEEDAALFKLSSDEEKQLKTLVDEVLADKQASVRKLTPAQVAKLILFVRSLETTLENTELDVPAAIDDADADGNLETAALANAEREETIPANSERNDRQVLLKKDIEHVGADTGLANVDHRIVKGAVQRVAGNRVYIKVGDAKKGRLTEAELYKFIVYLERKIAQPNGLFFDEFDFEDGQLSFRITRVNEATDGDAGAEATAAAPPRHRNEKRVDSASRVAQAVYKRRKDIQSKAGVEVAETGIGSGESVVPVERSQRDWLFYPILMICAFTITSLVVVLAVHMIKNRRRPFRNLPEVIGFLENKPNASYEELCRERMSASEAPSGGPLGKSGSTSSWPDDALLQSSNLDISTGHVILSWLQEFLDQPEKIADQWRSVADYTNASAETRIAARAENAAKNAEGAVLPYDETLVTLADGEYINASNIHDSDLRQVAYIVAQAPLDTTVDAFWRCIWEQGSTLIVNLCDKSDVYARYWPDEGAKTYGVFEVHLVSEHIWSECYVVRSFYLKNAATNETRTVTQFHYLAWPAGGVPTAVKSLLEFRRKVNKSYRGRASPVFVHSRTGADRAGTYVLIDMVLNRLTQGAGLKELNIAGSLEHLRDQRARMVGTGAQYQFMFDCVATEVVERC